MHPWLKGNLSRTDMVHQNEERHVGMAMDVGHVTTNPQKKTLGRTMQHRNILNHKPTRSALKT